MRGARTMTVLFTDLVGSTARASRLDPAAADQLRESHFALLRAEVEATDGAVVKSLGDGLMVAFDSARSALSCAVRMQQAVEHDNRGRDDPVAIRIGIGTGEVTEIEGDFFGDPVIAAARLVAVASGGQILATDVVRVVVGRHPGAELVDFGALELKGVPDPVTTVEVRWDPTPDSALAVPLSSRLESAVEAPFVGRDAELAVLLDALKMAGHERRRRVVLVAGEPGIGKTTLAGVFATLARERGSSVLYGRCDEDLGVPYQPWATALAHLVDHRPAGLLDAVLAAHGSDLSRLGPALSHLSAGAPGASSDPEMARYLLFGAVLRVLQAAGRDHPVVVVLDDLHWVDLPSLQLLRHLVASDMAPLLVVGTFRTSDLAAHHPLHDALASLHLEPGVTRMELQGLDTAELSDLLDAVGMSTSGDGDQLCDALERETDGNPFFVGELLRHLDETGLMTQDVDGRWLVRGEVSERGLPTSVRQVIVRRAARLGDEVVRVLSIAAVIGRDFDLGVLAAASGAAEEDLLDMLEAAATATLVVNVAGEGFSFVHALVEHALYEAISPVRRMRYHHRIAEAIEEICRPNLALHVTDLAYHYMQASGSQVSGGDATRAIQYARSAGDAALDRLAPDEALRWYRQALGLVDRQPDGDLASRCALLVGIGDAQRQSGDRAYGETLSAAARLAQELGERDLLIAAALATSRGVFSTTGAVDPDRLAMIEAALEAAGRADSKERARLLGLLAQERITSHDSANRQALVEEAVAIARRLRDPATLLYVLVRLLDAVHVPENLPDRLAATTEAEQLARRLGDPIGLFWTVYQRYYAALEAGDLAEAERCQEEAAAVASLVGQPTMRWLTSLHHAALVLLSGDASAAEKVSIQSLQIGESIGQPDALTLHRFQLHVIRWHQGRSADAVELVERLDREVELPMFHAARARVYYETGRRAEAEKMLLAETAARFPHLRDWSVLTAMSYWAEVAAGSREPTAISLLHEQLLPWSSQVICTRTQVAGAVAHCLGLLDAARRDYAAAEAWFAQALEMHQRLRAPFHIARTHLEWGRMMVARDGGRGNEADRHLEAARDIAAGAGCHAVCAAARQLLEESS